MKKLIFSFVAILLAAIAFVAFRPQDKIVAPKAITDQYWVLKPGRSISTNPSDYQLGGSPCSGSAEFCGFHAPENGTSDEPVISGNTETDLQNLEADPETPSNVSGKISYEN